MSGLKLKSGETIYLVYTDVKGSADLDNKFSDCIEWRKKAFCDQLKNLIIPYKPTVLKSIGDALFVIYENSKPREIELERLKFILHCVWKSTQDINYERCKIPIRAVVHRIEGHKRGNAIAQILTKKKILKSNNAFTQILRKDIFGTQVNLAARILSLSHGSCILVSNDVAKIINKDSILFAKSGKIIPFEYGKQSYSLHSPVPILYMKGVFNNNKSVIHNPYLVWELDPLKVEETPHLASEFKSSQSFRLILVEIRGSKNIAKVQAQIATEAIERLSFNRPNEKLIFYVDMLWKVIDYFHLHDATFDRITGKINPDNYLESINDLITKRLSKGNISILGQSGELKFSVNKNSIKNVSYNTQSRNIIQKAYLTPLIAFTSYPDINHGTIVRKMLSKDHLNNEILHIEPQTVELFRTIVFNKETLTKNMKEDGSTDFRAFSGKRCILLIFQIYFKFLKESDNPKKLFKGVKAINKSLEVAFWGLTSGLTDGFVLYICNNDKHKIDDINWQNGVNIILDKLVSIRVENFYSKIYPLAMYILEEDSSFVPQKRNIKYLDILNT